MLALLKAVSWPEARANRWRNATLLLAVALGVALAFSVHLINASALAEFDTAARAVSGAADIELRSAYRGAAGGFDESLYARVAAHPQVALASPVVEIEAAAVAADGRRVALRVLGLDLLVAARLSPALLAQPLDGEPRLAILDPDAIFLNPAARQALGVGDAPGTGTQVRLIAGGGQPSLRDAGRIAAPGPPLALVDIAGAQSHFGRVGVLDRIDIRLAPGADRDAVLHDFALPAGVLAATPQAAGERLADISRAYRVNLTVLALVALFTGSLLVFSVLSLSVARRTPQFALLGVLGMTGGERLRLVLAESAVLGAAGSVAGIALGTALAAFALRWLALDLGGGYFVDDAAAPLAFGFAAAIAYVTLGIAAAVAGGWLPARAMQRLAPAQALKAVALAGSGPGRPWLAVALLAAGALLAFAPPIGGLPIAAYAAVGCILLGGIACVPVIVAGLLRAVAPPGAALPLLAIERARRESSAATSAVAGVVASLALAVALTVMVASFRDSMTRWLDSVLPAALYVRAGAAGAGDGAFLAPRFVQDVAHIAGVERVDAQRAVQVQLAPARPAVTLLARPLRDPETTLPLVGHALPAVRGTVPVYVSEAMQSLYRATPGSTVELPLPDGRVQPLYVRAVWRDYARRQGTLLLDAADYRRLTGDDRVDSLALWLAPDAGLAAVRDAIEARALAVGAQVSIATTGELRGLSLRIFDRSFAVTNWLQAVAIAIGLVGIAAAFSAQVLARRREFGLLAHLGLTRRQIVAVVSAEGAVWTAAGTLLGLVLGLAVSVVLVEVVNPQSFHWTMELALPATRLALLCAAVLATGTLAAWLASRALAAGDMALAVKEDA